MVEPMPPLIAATQRCASPTSLPGGASLVRQLAGCLEAAAAAAPASAEYRAALCGEVAHFASTLYSSGWGCGYNNMQASGRQMGEGCSQVHRACWQL